MYLSSTVTYSYPLQTCETEFDLQSTSKVLQMLWYIGIEEEYNATNINLLNSQPHIVNVVIWVVRSCSYWYFEPCLIAATTWGWLLFTY